MRLNYVLVLLALIMTLFNCCTGCPRGFDMHRGLANHQNTCLIYKCHSAAALEKRRQLSHCALKQRRDVGQTIVRDTTQDLLIPSYDASANSEMPDQVPAASSERPPSPLPPALTQAGRPRRNYRIPRRYEDVPPEGPAAIPPPDRETAPAPMSIIPRVILYVRDLLRTGMNRFRLLREYPHRPSHDPDGFVSSKDLSDCHVSPGSNQLGSSGTLPRHDPPWPFANMSIYRLMEWATTGSNLKSQAELDRLAKDVICSSDFKAEDIVAFAAHREYKRFDASERSSAEDPFSADGWLESTVHISVPITKTNATASEDFAIPELHHRPLVSVMKAALTDTTARQFHFSPFKRIWTMPSGVEVRCFDEVYTSDVFLQEHEKLQRQQNEPGCKLEKVVLGLMFWSDSTHLASFGTAKVWPLYLYFANLSKYLRMKLASGASHHVAYIPSLPDCIHDFISACSQKGALLTHCRRELMQAVWNILLDEGFLAAYEHGFIMMCFDGIMRRFYPRIFTYSADYQEKVRIATIRDKGYCPCPRCLVTKAKFHLMGYARDFQARISNPRTYSRDLVVRAREFIYNRGYGVNSAAVERLLQPQSFVPTLNSFGEKLGRFGFDPFVMLVVDLMHEFELGIWKNVFIHLVRLLHVAAPAARLVTELDRRFRQVPTFGRSTIRRFSSNVSEMKKLAARDYEDILQCAIPTFEGLLPEPHNATVMTLLYRLAEWHALAKLRMHTDCTLGVLDATTTKLAHELRKFRDETCAAFTAFELPKEVAARTRRQQRARAAQQTSTSAPTNTTVQDAATPISGPGAASQEPSAMVVDPPPPNMPIVPLPSTLPPTVGKKKTFNISTYKFHALGDYVRTIKMFGTTDSYSSQIGELEHRRAKRLYGRTNKNHAVRQMTQHERHETRILRACRAHANSTTKTTHSHHVNFSENDPLPYTDAEMHHHISDSRAHYQDAFSFSKENPHDPATKHFVPKLKDHLLSRLLGLEYDGDELVSRSQTSIQTDDNK